MGLVHTRLQAGCMEREVGHACKRLPPQLAAAIVHVVLLHTLAMSAAQVRTLKKRSPKACQCTFKESRLCL